MRIVHFSDWHGEVHDLPPADLYVCTGDMLPNFRVYAVDNDGRCPTEWEERMELLEGAPRAKPPGRLLKKPPIPARERELQAAYLRKMGTGYLRKRLARPDAPVICCRGNHDFVDLAPMFGGDVREVGEDPAWITTAAAPGATPLRFGGVRGVKRHHGRWEDELDAAAFAERARRLPGDLDVLVTHAPPEGILDALEDERIGSPALRAYVARHDPGAPALRAHLFGHSHEGRGRIELGGTLFSNAATAWNVIDL